MNVSLELWILAVNLLLTHFKASCAAEHYVYDSAVPKCCYNPLPRCAGGAKADDETAAPQEYLAKIVRTTHDAVKPCADELFAVSSLCNAFLCVGNCFNEKTYECNSCTSPCTCCANVCSFA